MNDEIIKKNLMDELYWDARIDASDIKTELDDGKVRLEGTVPSYTTKIAADMDAWNISGVRSVINDLNVKFKVNIPDDKTIRNMVNNKMQWDPYLNDFKIEVEVNGGVVTLKGTVDAYWKKVAAESEAQSVMGVADVHNEMGIALSGTYADEDIAREIMDTLTRKAAVPEDSVNVAVDGGRVILTGTVPDWNASMVARNAAERTLGVVDVTNDLRIEG